MSVWARIVVALYPFGHLSGVTERRFVKGSGPVQSEVGEGVSVCPRQAQSALYELVNTVLKKSVQGVQTQSDCLLPLKIWCIFCVSCAVVLLCFFFVDFGFSIYITCFGNIISEGISPEDL